MMMSKRDAECALTPIPTVPELGDKAQVEDSMKILLGLSSEVNKKKLISEQQFSTLSTFFEKITDKIQFSMSKIGSEEIGNFFSIGAYILFIVAKAAMNENQRDIMGKTDFLSSVVSYMKLAFDILDRKLADLPKEESKDPLVQSCRVLGNSCYRNTENCNILVEISGSMKTIIRCIKYSDLRLKKYGLGALMNIVLQNDDAVAFLMKENYEHMFMDLLSIKLSASTLTSGENEELRCLIFGASILCAIKSTDMNMNYWIVPVYKLLNSVANILKEIEKSKDLPSIPAMEMLESFLSFIHVKNADNEFYENLFQKKYVDLAFRIAEENKYISKSQVSALAEYYQKCRVLAANLVSFMASCNENMAAICNMPNSISTFLKWATDRTGLDNSSVVNDLNVSGIICIGNASRSDETSRTVLKNKSVITTLVAITKKCILRSNKLASEDGWNAPSQTNPIVSQISKVVVIGSEEVKCISKALHALVGCLRNLYLGADGDPSMESVEIAEVVHSLIKEERFAFMHGNSISFARIIIHEKYDKVLCNFVTEGLRSPDQEVKHPFVYSPNSILNKILDVASKPQNENDVQMVNEAGRLLTKLVRILVNKKEFDCIKQILPLDSSVGILLRIITGYNQEACKKILSETPTAKIMEQGITEEPEKIFPTVQNECIVMLVLISTSCEDIFAKMKENVFILLNTLVEIINSETDEAGFNHPTMKVKFNSAIIMKNLMECSALNLGKYPKRLLKSLQALRVSCSANPPDTSVDKAQKEALNSLISSMIDSCETV